MKVKGERGNKGEDHLCGKDHFTKRVTNEILYQQRQQ